MKYEIEELLPRVASLSEEYTSKESSSVSYEVARMLMEAVIYCIDECYSDGNDMQLPDGDKIPCKEAYETGYDRVIEKVHKSKEIYERIIDNFEDYGCRNYRDTIIKGIPGFFLKYDVKFNPQNHILTMDYPTLNMNFDKCGVNLIFEYLKAIEIEKRFLDQFSRQAVVQLLERIQPEYKSIYLDNICYPVLLNTVECVIADKPVYDLEIDKQDRENIRVYFKDDDVGKIELKIRKVIQLVTDRMADCETQKYFSKISNEYAVRIFNTLQNDFPI